MGQLLRIDSLAGLFVGTGMLLSHGWLSALYEQPVWFVLMIALINLAYGSVSFMLRRTWPHTPRRAVWALAGANMFWGVVCLVLAAFTHGQSSVFGTLALVGEAAFVGGLGLQEWRTLRRGA